MAVGLLATGSIYSLFYTNWKTNIKIYAFILYGMGPKVHLLNLGARQLSVVDRAKIVRVIVKLSKIKNSTKYNGALLYRIFKQYLWREISKCYRTLHSHLITKAALINYGLNNEEDFSDLEKSFQNKQMFEQARRDIIMKLINLYTGRGVKLNTLKNKFATTMNVPPPKTNVGPTPTEPEEPTEDTGGEPEGYY